MSPEKITRRNKLEIASPKCPVCGQVGRKQVLSTFQYTDYGIMRERFCGSCRRPFLTLETIVGAGGVKLRTEDGYFEEVDRQRLEESIFRQMKRRPLGTIGFCQLLAVQIIAQVVTDTNSKLQGLEGTLSEAVRDTYIDVADLRTATVRKLARVDPVACARYFVDHYDFTDEGGQKYLQGQTTLGEYIEATAGVKLA